MAFRDGPLQDLKVPLTWAAVAATLAAAIVAMVLLLGGRTDAAGTGGYAPVRSGFARAAGPVAGVISAPVRWTEAVVDYVEGYVFAISENRRLKREVQDLEGWRDAAVALKNVNDRYEALLKLKTEPPIPMVSGRAVTDSRGPFSNARLLDVGSDSGVKVGDPAMSEHGVVGRIVGAAPGVSRMLLLTDVESRTPVLVDRTNGRAILTGDGSAYPRLEYVRGRDPVKTGDVVLTSGDGGVFPRGLPVGVAVKDLKGVWRLRLYSDATPIDFVRVLLFQDFSQSVDPQSLADSPAPALLPSEAADRNAVLARAAAASAPKPSPAAAPPSTATLGAPAAAGKKVKPAAGRSAPPPAQPLPAPAASPPADAPAAVSPDAGASPQT